MQTFVYNSRVRSVIGVIDRSPWAYIYNDDIYGNLDFVWINHSFPGDVQIIVKAIRTSSISSKRNLSIAPATPSFTERPVPGEKRASIRLNDIFLKPCVKLIDLSSYILNIEPPSSFYIKNGDNCTALLSADEGSSVIQYSVKTLVSGIHRAGYGSYAYALRSCLSFKPGDIVNKVLYL